MDFDLWLEFEQYEPDYPSPEDNPRCDSCIINITVGDCKYAANVWTFGLLEYCRSHDTDTDKPLEVPAPYLVPPDLLVEQLSRGVIEHAIQGLLLEGSLPDSWRILDSD